VATLAAQLASVQAAIAAVESGAQSYIDDDGAAMTYPSLEVLYKREERLLSRTERGDSGRIKVSEF
jgi:hypothetical protein